MWGLITMTLKRDEFYDEMVANGCSLVNMQELADRFVGGYNAAPQKPLGGEFVISEYGGLVDTCFGTGPTPTDPALTLKLGLPEQFNILGLNEAPEPATSISVDPDLTTTPTSPFTPLSPNKKK